MFLRPLSVGLYNQLIMLHCKTPTGQDNNEVIRNMKSYRRLCTQQPVQRAENIATLWGQQPKNTTILWGHNIYCIVNIHNIQYYIVT